MVVAMTMSGVVRGLSDALPCIPHPSDAICSQNPVEFVNGGPCSDEIRGALAGCPGVRSTVVRVQYTRANLLHARHLQLYTTAQLRSCKSVV